MSEQAAVRQRRHVDRRRRVGVVGAVGAAALVVVVVVSLTQSGNEGGDGTVAAGAALPPWDSEPAVVHVHGPGVDPGDGMLCAATHWGVFRVPEQGKENRVANRAQDTMGFSIVGPGEFIGSGHPDFREDDVTPPLLGLISSEDRGETWDRISLHRKADLHALHAAQGKVHGDDSTSQTFMVSENRTDWDRQWRPPTGAPTLVVLAWAGRGQLYGVAPDGTVARSADGGVTWAERGTVGG